MNATRLAFFALSVLVFAGPVGADDAGAGVTAQVSPTTARLGDVITLDLTVHAPNGFTVGAPALQNLGTFEVRQSTALPLEVSGAQTLAHFRAELQNFATGQQQLPPIEIPYQDIQGSSHTLKTAPLQVTVQEEQPGPKEKGDIRGIKGVVGPVGWSPWWWVLVVLLLVGGGIYAWSLRQKKIAGPPPPPPVPADEEALKALEQLRATGWIESGKLKEFYSGLSDVVRAYLEKGFGVPALERTTNELMRDIRRRPVFSSERLVDLQTLLEEGDLVKFAKFRPEAGEALNAHAMAVKFVESTRDALEKESES